METQPNQNLGIVVTGSVEKGTEVRLDSSASVEDMVVGRYVTIEGKKRRFFGMVTDISLALPMSKSRFPSRSASYTRCSKKKRECPGRRDRDQACGHRRRDGLKADTDRDGLTDDDEQAARDLRGAGPDLQRSADSDGDGYTDLFEERNRASEIRSAGSQQAAHSHAPTGRF